jgi:adenosine deaminase
LKKLPKRKNGADIKLVGSPDFPFYQNLPKVELHRHLEGSLRLRTIVDVARATGMTVPLHTRQLGNMVQVQNGEAYTFQNFLAKFATLRMFYRSPDIIHRITREAVEDAALDNIRYLELRFTPIALSRAERFPLGEVIDWVCESAEKAAQEFGIQVRLLASVNRHESVELAEQVVWLAADRIAKNIVGIDLAGNEAECEATPFAGIFREARESGLRICVHAGEWAGARSVWQALVELGAERIAHGVRVLEDETVVALARERQSVFEVCLTSNQHTGVVNSIEGHPLLKLMAAGLNITLNTDDPSISQITLSNEYQQACETIGLSQAVLKERILAAAQGAFLPIAQRQGLIERIKKELYS